MSVFPRVHLQEKISDHYEASFSSLKLSFLSVIKASREKGKILPSFQFATSAQSFFNETAALCDQIVTEARNGGLRAAEILCEANDLFLHQVCAEYLTKNGSKQICVVAVGGYGRGLCAPYSDIDLLVLCQNEAAGKNAESALQDVFCTIWDAKRKLGHALHDLDGVFQQASVDLHFRTSILDTRKIYGAAGLYDEFKKRRSEFFQSDRKKEFIRLKMAEQEARHIKAGHSRYPVEPNVKEGKGALRDLQNLHWLEKFLIESESQGVLTEFFEPADLVTLEQAEKFLWTLRFHLHSEAGKAEELLSFGYQNRLAKKLKYHKRDGAQEAQRMMKQYFLTARKVGDLTRIYCNALQEKYQYRTRFLSLPFPLFAKITSFFQPARVTHPDFIVRNERLTFKFPEEILKKPELIVKLFRISDETGAEPHPEALKIVRRALPILNRKFRELTEPYEDFRAILCRGVTPEISLRRLVEAGLLGKLFPQLEPIIALTQFNMYHHYTVDEHLIRAVGALKEIDSGLRKAEHPLANHLIKDIHHKEALYLSVFLHDALKGGDRDHSEAGAEFAYFCARKLGFSENESLLVEWLVLHHLAMSDTSQRRDLSDPEVIEKFADLVRSPERLRLLLILTVADIRAVGPGVWNGWKGELLRRLYRETSIRLTGEPGGAFGFHGASASIERLKQEFKEEYRQKGLQPRYDFNDFPPAYWRNIDAVTARRHHDLMIKAREMNKDAIAEMIPDRDHDMSEALIFAPDYSGLFAGLAGTLSSAGISVKAAKILTGPNETALDSFVIQDQSGGAIYEKSHSERIIEKITEVIKEKKIDFSAERSRVFAKYTPDNPFSLAAEVIIDNRSSADHTLIEISAPDRPFLLYDLACVLLENGLSVRSAHINTYGDKATDIFYVKNKFGMKAEGEVMIDKLRAELSAAAILC